MICHFIGDKPEYTEQYQQYKQLTEMFSENIVEIHLADDIELPSFEDVITNLKNLKNLRKLKICCGFESYTSLPDNLNLCITSLTLNPLNTLDVVSVKVFYSILSCTPYLTTLKVHIDDANIEEEIVKYLKKTDIRKGLKVLKWYPDYNDFHLFDVLKIENWNLEKFSIRTASRNFKAKDFENFLFNQKKLEALEIVVRRIEKPLLQQIVQFCCLKNVQHLSFGSDSFNHLDDKNLEAIWNVKHLKLEDQHIPQTCIYLTKPSEMKSLTIIGSIETVGVDNLHPALKSNQNENINTMIRKLYFLKNLKSFTYNSFEPLNEKNNLLQGIFQHLINLQELCFSDYTDTASTDTNINVS